jgi:predicted nucleic acid-binding protein
MLVVSNTSPLRYLVEVEAVDVLPKLFDQLITTPQVMGELRLGHFPEVVRKWAEHPPAWLQIERPGNLRFTEQLDDGEASAVSLACERRASLILIDERAGREVSRSAGLAPRGTLGVIIQAAIAEHLDFEDTLNSLTSHTRFRHTAEVIQAAKRHYEMHRHFRK